MCFALAVFTFGFVGWQWRTVMPHVIVVAYAGYIIVGVIGLVTSLRIWFLEAVTPSPVD